MCFSKCIELYMKNELTFIDLGDYLTLQNSPLIHENRYLCLQFLTHCTTYLWDLVPDKASSPYHTLGAHTHTSMYMVIWLVCLHIYQEKVNCIFWQVAYKITLKCLKASDPRMMVVPYNLDGISHFQATGTTETSSFICLWFKQNQQQTENNFYLRVRQTYLYIH